MPPRPNTSSSLMVQSAKDNKEKLRSLVELYNHKRNEEGDDTNFEEAGKNRAKKFNFFRWISKKTSGKNVGRFMPKVEDRLDSISGLASGDAKMPKGAYFDPLGLKIIKPDIVQVIGSEYEQGVEFSEDMAAQIESDFVDRVDEEIANISENDYEKRLMDENSELALIQSASDYDEENTTEMWLNEAAEVYNAGRAFVPEPGYVEAIPDSFQIELKVDEAPEDYSLEWEQYKADRLKSFSSIVGNYFKSFLGIKTNKTPNMKAMEQDFIRTLPEYNRIRREGEQKAKNMKVKYDPELDNQLQNFVVQIHKATKSTNSGHSLVKLIAKRGGMDLSVYSFVFGALANPGMAGAVTGQVVNPAGDGNQNVVMTRQNISYSDYLKAAAKIRGVVGSMKTYSYLRYNCTSFAASVAQAAGLDIKPEDTTRKMMTLRHRSELIETPYDFSRYIRYLNSKKQEDMDTARDKEMLEKITEPYLTRFENEYKNNRYLKILASYGMVDLNNAKEKAQKKISDIVAIGYYIDKKYPLENLMGDDFGEAVEKKAREKSFALGARSEEQAIERLFSPENEGKAFKMFIDFDFTPENIGGLLEDQEFDISDEYAAEPFLRSLSDNEYFKNRYSDLPNADKLKNRIAEMTLGRIKGMQSQIIGQIIAGCEGKEDVELVEAFVSGMGEYTFGMLSHRVLDSGEALERFVQLSGVELPYITKDGVLADSETEAYLLENPNVQLIHVFDKNDAAAMISMSEIIDSEIVMHFTRRFREEIGIYGFSKKTKAPFGAASELEDFFVEAARMPELKDDVDKLLDQVIKHDGYDIRDYTEFFEQVIFKLSPDKLADLMVRSQIE